MKMTLRSNWICGENVIMPGCDKSEALFRLLQNRSTLRVMDLPLIAKMGFEIELSGDIQPLIFEMDKKDIARKKEEGKIIADF